MLRLSLSLSFCLFSLLQLLELIAKSQLPSLSGVAQKNYMNILERVVQKGELSWRHSTSLPLSFSPSFLPGGSYLSTVVSNTHACTCSVQTHSVCIIVFIVRGKEL